MNDDYLTPFLDPVKQVWEKELGHAIQMCGVETIAHQFTTEDVTALVPISGQLEGSVLFGFNKDTAKAIVSEIVGFSSEDFNEVALSALGELANMIPVQAVSRLNSNGLSCQMGQPIFVQSAGRKLDKLAGPQKRAVFHSDIGFLFVRVGLNEQRQGESLEWLWQRFN